MTSVEFLNRDTEEFLNRGNLKFMNRDTEEFLNRGNQEFLECLEFLNRGKFLNRNLSSSAKVISVIEFLL